MSDKTCSTCTHWQPSNCTHWSDRETPSGTCYGDAANYAEAEADDDQGLVTSFCPPATFGCNCHAPKN